MKRVVDIVVGKYEAHPVAYFTYVLSFLHPHGCHYEVYSSSFFKTHGNMKKSFYGTKAFSITEFLFVL